MLGVTTLAEEVEKCCRDENITREPIECESATDGENTSTERAHDNEPDDLPYLGKPFQLKAKSGVILLFNIPYIYMYSYHSCC